MIMRSLGLWLAVCIALSLAICFLIVLRSHVHDTSSASVMHPARAAPMQNEQAAREYVLEVIGLGVTLDKFRQGNLWKALQGTSAHSSIREQDPRKYPWAANDKDGMGGGRACDALENGVSLTPVHWGVPSFYAGASIFDPGKQPDLKRPMAGLVAGASTIGLPLHLFSIAPWRLSEQPDRLLEDVFNFFDRYPDIPYVLVHSEDSPGTRDGSRMAGTPRSLIDGYYIPAMPDTTAVFILARRDRVDSLRPHVWEDPNRQFVKSTLKAMYYDLKDSLANTDESLGVHPFPMPRQPTVNEWLSAAAAFAQRPDVRGTGLQRLDGFNPWQHRPPRDWNPTPWFPIPWSVEQMESFDRLPSFGFVHRPVFVKFTDGDGKQVERRDQRQKILNAGWQQSLQTLPEAERSKGPSRMIVATGRQREQLLILHGMLSDYAAQGGPEIDTGKTAQFIDTDLRLGNTGAATFFMQMAIGVMGSYRDGGASAAINLRDRNEASIIFITPPTEARRKEQDAGGDIFRSRITPAVDPANYQAPSIEALLESQHSQ